MIRALYSAGSGMNAVTLSASKGVAAQPPSELDEDTNPEPETNAEAAEATFDAALEPVRRRMERVKLSESFVRNLLVAQAELDPGEVAPSPEGGLTPLARHKKAAVGIMSANRRHL